MKTCRLPLECVNQLASRQLGTDGLILGRLLQFCLTRKVRPAAPWKFAEGVSIPLPAGVEPGVAEAALVGWAVRLPLDWSWATDASLVPLRPEQAALQAVLAQARPGAIALVEASTGIGKTRVFARFAQEGRLRFAHVVMAVPTLAVGRQWLDEWDLLGAEPLAQVWGRAQYGDDEGADAAQLGALEAARQARCILCSHGVLAKLLDALEGDVLLLVDEAHLLATAVAGLSGEFFPAASLGPRFLRWCQASDVLAAGGEVLLTDRMRQVAARRLRSGDGAAISVVGSLSHPLVWVRDAGSVAAALGAIWQKVRQAALFSGTLTWSSAAGVATTSLMARRLAIPAARHQDLGRVRAGWRDEGVQVLLPDLRQGQDGRVWLGAYRDRVETWRAEVAAVLSAMPRDRKTLVLLTSYADVEGVTQLLRGVAGVTSSAPGEPVEAALSRLAREDSWCWIATGAAWTGMDSSVPLQRLVIGKLPLPTPEQLQAGTQDAVFDAVSRFRQGIGRLVRGAGGSQLEVVLLDGRINDTSARWRRVCQPFLQVLGEDFDDHLRFGS